MRKKYYYLLIGIIAFYLIGSPFVGIEAKNSEEQPEVCAGPSKTMIMYFQFQNDMMSAMLGSELSEKRFVTTKSDGGLFKENFLTLGEGSINALDIIATNLRGSIQAAGSSITTLTVLLSLAEASVIQSNTEGLWILTKDRVIVREYKRLLDIESSLMDLAYFLSQRVSLISKFEGNLLNNIESVIKKYQELGLLEKTSNLDSLKGATIADIMMEIILMNAYMKHFVLFNGGLGGFESTIIPKFNQGAIDKLEDDYRGLGVFGECNQYASNFKNTISKGVGDKGEAVKQAMDDVMQAAERLDSALDFSYGNDPSQKSNRCDMSEYEMAQLRAYRGGNRSCKTSFINGNVGALIQQALSNNQELSKEKKAQSSQKEKTTKLSKEEKKISKYQKKIEKTEKKIKEIEKEIEEIEKNKGKIEEETKEKIRKIKEDTADEIYLIRLEGEIDKAKDTKGKRDIWRDLYGTGEIFNITYSGGFNTSLVGMYSDLMDNYKQSHENAMSSDLSYELVNIKAILDQMEDTNNKMDELKDTLKDISKYQCKG